MEYTVTQIEIRLVLDVSKGLNPCFSGIYCDEISYSYLGLVLCLNPCFSGIYCDMKVKADAESYYKS